MGIHSLNKLLVKEVSRKEFLLYLGLLFVTITGISSVLNNLSSLNHSKAKSGFGSKPYGM